jgi:D-alanyl-D-alanine carboxypeptidase
MTRTALYRLSAFVTAALVGTAFLVAPLAAKPRYTAIVVEEQSGHVLYSNKADTPNHPASLTKIMTLYMLFEAIEVGRFNLNSKLKVSRHASRQPPSKLGLKIGSTITVKQAILALVTKSANDVAVVVAEALGKTEKNFAIQMTRRARQMNMQRTTFKNASGLHHSKQVSTARDMARLAKLIRLRFPKYYAYFSTKNFRFRGRTYGNHNNLLGRYDGVDGIKTGYTLASGFNLVSAVERDGTRLIGVVFGGKTARSRDRQMVRILDRAFAKVDDVPAKSTRLARSFFRVAEPRLRFAKAPVPRQRPDLSSPTTKFAAVLDEKQQKRSAANWAVQFGAFTNFEAAEKRVAAASQLLGTGDTASSSDIERWSSTAGTIYRTRFVELTQAEAVEVCKLLVKTGMGCLKIRP